MANQIQRTGQGGLTWHRRRTWTKKEWTIVASAFILIILTFSRRARVSSKDNQESKSSPLYKHSDWVTFTPLSNAHKKVSLCSDGSTPGYHMQKGFGSGSHSWHLHIEGGGWCNTISSCSSGKRTALGSSKNMEPQVQFSGILSNDPLQNPDFFKWNKVKIRYCDGASFAGHPEAELKNGTELFFRGQLIWEAIVDQLLSMGLSNARQAPLSGCLAGGLATLIHCDDFPEALPKDANVKCLADAGFEQNLLVRIDYCMLSVPGRMLLETKLWRGSTLKLSISMV